MLNITQIASNTNAAPPGLLKASAAGGNADVLKDTFQQFVGETFFQMMLKSMHKTHGEPAYLHGGQAEEIFQSQLDQELASGLSQTAGASFSDDLFQLFRLQMEQPIEDGEKTVADPVRGLLNP
jgi:Rod binding domain-containing protein